MPLSRSWVMSSIERSPRARAIRVSASWLNDEFAALMVSGDIRGALGK